MRPSDFFLLIMLAAIWGGSFIFMRMVAPVMGAIAAGASRVLIAGTGLFLWSFLSHQSLNVKENKYNFVIIGLVSAGLPALLFSYAALHLEASIMVIMNATAPLWGAVLDSYFLSEKITPKKTCGLILGLIGVIIVAYPKIHVAHTMLLIDLVAILACLGATLCYAISGIYIKQHSSHIPPRVFAVGGQASAALLLLPLNILYWPTQSITPITWLNLAILGLLCSGVAFLLYFGLIARIGPTRALTVTFLMPIFGLLWSHWLLGEKITASISFGCLIILVGTGLVLHKRETTVQQH